MNGIGFRLKVLLRDKKMTIKELAFNTGISVNTLYSITKRDSTRVDPVILQRIAYALDVHMHDLTGKDLTVFETQNNCAEITELQFNADRDRILLFYSLLNDEGRRVAADRIQELTEIPKYQNKEMQSIISTVEATMPTQGKE